MKGSTVKKLMPGVALAMVGAGLVAVPALTAQAAPQGPDATASLVQKMQAVADGTTVVQKERATGKVGFIRAKADGDLLPGNSQAPAAKADAYLDTYAQAFGAPRAQLVRSAVTKGEHGTVVDYVQTYKGVPVFGGMLRAHVDADGDLTSVNGETVPGLDLSVTPRFDKDAAGQHAVNAVKADPPGTDGKADLKGIKAKTSELMVYRTGLVKGETGDNMLVWRVEVTNEKNVRDIVFVDAMTNKPVNRYSMIHDALDRAVYEADEDRNLTRVWQEGDEFPGDLNEDQQNLVNSAGEAYWFFKNSFDRDSYDGNGARMNTINNDPAIECPNANWNGITTNYCNGVTSDDVVAHEWGHAYTEYTHGLIYQWQAGALNEAYSDIWGETIDLINGREDEGEGNLTVKRPVGLCSTNSPALPLLSINAPSDIARDCLTGGASFGQQLDAEGLTGDVVIPTDAVEDGGTATDGCSPYEQDVTGKIVMVDRGLCAFTDKAVMATQEGAAGLIIGNRDDSPIGMSGDDTTLVPTVSIGLTDREAIRTAVDAGKTVNVTMKDAGGERYDSYRWLVGEKSPAFGGAIRDMWNPNCYGDPGKVSDAEYKCSTDDNGGVHGNSGVANHGYALLVDGGTFNGVTVKGIGLDKAAHIYFTAMNEYQTPVSDFVDHANSLEASCAQLTGKRLTKLSTAEATKTALNAKIDASDCEQVAAMARAIELRKEPTQCEFQPLLPDEAGAPCGKGFDSRTVWSEDFEDGLDGWTQDAEIPEGSQTFEWESEAQAPSHDSMTAFAPDPASYGDCVPFSGDYSSAASLISPEIVMPAEGEHPLLSFDHYVATELGYDGGLVRAKINDGDFEDVPADAFVVNGYNDTMEPAPNNTSPLAGQEGFTGTDGGQLHGSWNTSRIDLEALGAEAGDTVQFSFVMGRDGCNGFDGWYVDDVELTVCDVAPVTEPVASTTKATAKPKKIASKKKSAKVTVTVKAGELTPTGKVTITLKGKVVAKGTLTDGKAVLTVKGKKLKKGKNKLVATYAGNDEVKSSSAKFTIKRKK
ncbi:M4 family metallopeptidase [Nocardioides daejeonensis]|uniref:M4 family metallopeptidase n=1 Tax=Nocardioides daejeonensis TaxID=1046556 RepID=UPI000D74BE69|nr:M4 family metallopeptidase [Nocardioides daejeonensis]